MRPGHWTQVREMWEVPRDLLLRRYPPFVTGGALPRGAVPVFVFHSAEQQDLERKLAHLAENGYVTLSATEYLDVLRERRPAPERAVLLTFDDGRASVSRVAHPLLARHGMKAVLFLVPGRILATPAPAGSAEGLVSWPEVDALARSGLWDIESHTLTHARIHTGPALAGFLTPEMQHGYPAMDVPLLAGDGADWLPHESPLGTPLLRSAPRMGEALRFFEEPVSRARCTREVQDGGGAAFFRRPGWQRRLARLVGGAAPGRLESPPEREAAIVRELLESRRLIEEHTNRPVLHLCYPWHVSGPTARRMAAELGYVTAFCGKVPGVPITLPGGDLLKIARLGEDYVELLPGRGRQRLTDVLRRKWRRRLGRPTAR